MVPDDMDTTGAGVTTDTPSTGSSRPDGPDTKEVEVADLTIDLTARQWEAIAAGQQYRLFAIYDFAEKMGKLPGLTTDLSVPLKSITDLCKLHHNELVRMGLLRG